MKYPTMTEFVLDQEKRFEANKEGWAVDYIDSIFRYASFIKQPLKNEMFVPCDKEGNVLEEPKCEIFDKNIECNCNEEQGHKCHLTNHKYKKAKEKVLFEGFSFQMNGFYCSEEEVIQQVREGEFKIFKSDFTRKVETIEDLLNAGANLATAGRSLNEILTQTC